MTTAWASRFRTLRPHCRLPVLRIVPLAPAVAATSGGELDQALERDCIADAVNPAPWPGLRLRRALVEAKTDANRLVDVFEQTRRRRVTITRRRLAICLAPGRRHQRHGSSRSIVSHPVLAASGAISGHSACKARSSASSALRSVWRAKSNQITAVAGSQARAPASVSGQRGFSTAESPPPTTSTSRPEYGSGSVEPVHHL